MDTTPQDLSIESIERVLTEKEAVLAKEQAMLEGLRGLLGRMGYTLVPAHAEAPRQSRRGRPPGSSVSPEATSVAPGSRRRGRPPRAAPVPPDV